MPKLLSAVAASALLVALAAPSFAADLNGSASQRNSTTIQNRSSAGVNTRSGSAQLNDRDDANSSTSLNSKPTLDRDRDIHRQQSAQMPNENRDNEGPGRSGTSPGHEMQENGPVPGAPGHR